jgi:hypothetical protein
MLSSNFWPSVFCLQFSSVPRGGALPLLGSSESCLVSLTTCPSFEYSHWVEWQVVATSGGGGMEEVPLRLFSQMVLLEKRVKFSSLNHKVSQSWSNELLFPTS